MHNLITTPIPTSADLFQVADLCTAFATELMESKDVTQRLALSGRLSYALTALRLLCDADLPAHLKEQLTVDELPTPCVPDCWIDSWLLVGYAQSLTQALLARSKKRHIKSHILHYQYLKTSASAALPAYSLMLRFSACVQHYSLRDRVSRKSPEICAPPARYE